MAAWVRLLVLLVAAVQETMSSARQTLPQILVIGSLNMDTIIDVQRLPQQGESIVTRLPDTGKSVPGGKGANQAVAVARLCGGNCVAKFVGQFGNDAHAQTLERSLADNGVDLSACGRTEKPSGQGLVFLVEDGTVSSIVVGGSNMAWASDVVPSLLPHIQTSSAVLLQREIPEHVNVAVAHAAAAAGVPVFQDIGGEDRPISDELLRSLTFVSPNLPELQRLTAMPAGSEAEVVAAARFLKTKGAQRVLVTRGGDGALLLEPDGRIWKQPPCEVPGGQVLDETGAGDSFRAAFAVAFVEGKSSEDSLRFAAAAGAVAVSQLGAFPSLPTRLRAEWLACPTAIPWSGGSGAEDDGTCIGSSTCAGGGGEGSSNGAGFPLKFGSRLNSMADRLDLWGGANDVLGWVSRQGTVKGLGVIDFNYPQHFAASGLTAEAALEALGAAGLEAGAVQMRFSKEFRAGAFTNPDDALWRRAVALTIEGGAMAQALGARELVVWSAWDGYDYSAQADYVVAWNKTVLAFRAVCDAHPDLRVSVEYKPTDENTRFYIVGSVGAAKLLVQEVGRSNMGVTIDVGHCLMAGENPAQSVAMLGDRLFGIHLNDGHSRLGAEDGLMFGSVHSVMAMELMYWLQKTGYQGHLYMDTFPQNEDPVRECEFNIRRVKALWARAERLRTAGLDALLAKHDALGVLELMEGSGEL